MTTDRYLLDANVLLALALGNHQHHEDAHRALRSMSAWSMTPVTESAFLRLMLNPAVGARTETGSVLSQLRSMRSDPRWSFLPDHLGLLDSGIDLAPLAGHRQVTDFHLVAIARAGGAILATFDRALPLGLAPSDRSLVEVLPVR